MISDLFRCPYEAVTYPTSTPSTCMASSSTYAPTSSWTTCSRTWTSQISRFFSFIDTGSVMVVSPTKLISSVRNRLKYFVRISLRPTLWRHSETCASLHGRTQEISISTSLAWSGTLLTKTPLPIKISLSPLASLWHPQKHPTPCDILPSVLLTISRLSCSSACALANI